MLAPDVAGIDESHPTGSDAARASAPDLDAGLVFHHADRLQVVGLLPQLLTCLAEQLARPAEQRPVHPRLLEQRSRDADVLLQQRQAEVDQLKGQVEGAKWNLDKTVVRAPADGYVTNLALRKGARVASLPLAPVMAFIDTSDTIIGVEIPQINARYVEPGQPVELTFKFAPGETYTGKVESVLQAIASGQARVSGTAVTPEVVSAAPFIVRVKLDDQAFAARLPAGATGDAAIFTDRVKAAHVIRRVLLRQIAITNYVNPF